MQETIVIKSDFERNNEWLNAFKNFDIEVCFWDDVVDRNNIDYALVWKPEPGALVKFPNLKLIFSIGAGLDHLKGPNLVPSNIPVIRMVEDLLTLGMAEYVLYHVLRFHRFMPQYEENQRQRQWKALMQIPAAQRTVGILGLGVLGGAVAEILTALGFHVIGWSRTAKQIQNVTSYHGTNQLDSFLGQTEILVCLLPLTDQTCHILNANNLAKLPAGANLINAGRGGHQVQSEIVDLLDSGHLSGAALDVFEQEPLHEDSPLWTHPKITITPHVASMTTPASSAKHVCENIQRYRGKRPLTHVADLERGY